LDEFLNANQFNCLRHRRSPYTAATQFIDGQRDRSTPQTFIVFRIALRGYYMFLLNQQRLWSFLLGAQLPETCNGLGPPPLL